jgi:hypothetical protein
MTLRRPSARSCFRSLIGILAAGGCAANTQTTDHVMPRDAETFDKYVQPYLQDSCATLDCHGAPGRALRLYSELGLRADANLRATPIATHHEPKPLTPRESEANRVAFASVALATHGSGAELALRKPLAAAAGGIHHQGGVHWKTRTDPGYLCLRGWLIGDIGQDLPSVCAQALEATQK